MQLTPEQINDFISNAILESQIGEAVKEAIEKAVKSLSQKYDNPFDAVVRNHVVGLIDSELRTNYKPMLEEKIKKALNEFLTEEILERITEAAIEKLRNRY